MIHLDRELKDMDEKIDVLEGTIIEYRGLLDDTVIENLQEVVDEWRDYTRKILVECIRLKLEGVLDAL